MAPVKPTKTTKPKSGADKSKPGSLVGKGAKSTKSAKPKSSTHNPSGTVKAKSKTGLKKKKRVYSEKELGIQKLNTIVPAGVQKPKGKKKGKVFVDDQESMMTILAMVNADKEGQIESKMMKQRQMEEIREARKKEAEARQDHKKAKLEETKNSLKKQRKRKSDTSAPEKEASPETKKAAKPKKRVSFG
ncbi:hypothetical protein K490DRAFT_67359 [Saccharata proteae CBS 121410]|uniref:60S ribosomal subunit assembly/export protein LOC1 n=1 Tax=Saccharata proteae CBS 121410 TaxID=1314787 RepID=A0A9P4HTR4_9PEZI|nr:hypothetical protein K490DRAFT_67359 [Saccharata proteae CBS 121410]